MTDVALSVDRVRDENKSPDESAQPDAGSAGAKERLVGRFVKAACVTKKCVRSEDHPERHYSEPGVRPWIGQHPDSQPSSWEKNESGESWFAIVSLEIVLGGRSHGHLSAPAILVASRMMLVEDVAWLLCLPDAVVRAITLRPKLSIHHKLTIRVNSTCIFH